MTTFGHRLQQMRLRTAQIKRELHQLLLDLQTTGSSPSFCRKLSQVHQRYCNDPNPKDLEHIQMYLGLTDLFTPSCGTCDSTFSHSDLIGTLEFVGTGGFGSWAWLCSDQPGHFLHVWWLRIMGLSGHVAAVMWRYDGYDGSSLLHSTLSPRHVGCPLSRAL